MQLNTKNRPVIAFIGGGNMAGSLIGGLISSGWPSELIRASEPLDTRRAELETMHDIICHKDNVECIRDADLVVLAVKPQILRDVVLPLGDILRDRRPLLLSIAAGIRSRDILSWIGMDLAFVRVMPNTPALIRCGVSGIWANGLVNPDQRSLAEEAMSAVGKVVWVENESLIDTITGISGSGPAYFFKLMELMMTAAGNHGLDEESARTLVVETALGAASLTAHSELSPRELRHNVTSPGGTTEAGIQRMEQNGMDDAVLSGISSAVSRSRVLSDQFGGG